jgi:hypothetical protein
MFDLCDENLLENDENGFSIYLKMNSTSNVSKIFFSFTAIKKPAGAEGINGCC